MLHAVYACVVCVCRLWEDAATWGSGGVPAPGGSVTLPANTRVLVTGCSWRASGANVYSSIVIPDTSEVRDACMTAALVSGEGEGG